MRMAMMKLTVLTAIAAMPAALHAAPSDGVPLPGPRPSATLSSTPKATATPNLSANTPAPSGGIRLTRAAVRAIVEREAERFSLPADIAEAVVRVESSFNPATIGAVGEIGLMQVRPETAAMLGFRGSNAELAEPDINIHYGVKYLGKAWRLAGGDLCRALMKYRAGHGEEVMSPLSVTYCNRARSHLASLASPYATIGATGVVLPAPEIAEPRATPILSATVIAEPQRVYRNYKQGSSAASRAFWTAKEAQVRAIKLRLASKWRHVASR